MVLHKFKFFIQVQVLYSHLFVFYSKIFEVIAIKRKENLILEGLYVNSH